MWLVSRPKETVIRTNPSFWDILCAHDFGVPASPQAAPHATADLIAALVTLQGVHRYVCILVAPATSREKVHQLLNDMSRRNRALARSGSAAPRLSCLSTLGIAQRAWQPSCTCCRYLSSTWHVPSSPLTRPVRSLRVSRHWSHGCLCLHGSSCGGGVLCGF